MLFQTVRCSFKIVPSARERLTEISTFLWFACAQEELGGTTTDEAGLAGLALPPDAKSNEVYAAVKALKAKFEAEYTCVMGNIAAPPPVGEPPAPPDAIIIPTHPQLVNAGMGAAYHVHRWAGRELNKYLNRLLDERNVHTLDVGTAVVCPGFNTGLKAIIMVVSPPGYVYSKENQAQAAARGYKNALCAVRNDPNLHTAAIASIATGVSGMSVYASGSACARAVMAHLALGGGPVTAVLWEDHVYDAFAEKRARVVATPLAPPEHNPDADIITDPQELLHAHFATFGLHARE